MYKFIAIKLQLEKKPTFEQFIYPVTPSKEGVLLAIQNFETILYKEAGILKFTKLSDDGIIKFQRNQQQKIIPLSTHIE